MSETEWRTLMQAARSLGISLSRAERFAASLSTEDYYALELPNGTRIRQVRLPALRALYQAQRYRHGERRDGQEVATPPTIASDREEAALREQVASLYQLLLSEREQRIQDQAAQIARLETALSHSSVSHIPLTRPRARPLRRSNIGNQGAETTRVVALGLLPMDKVDEIEPEEARPNIAAISSPETEQDSQTSLPQTTKSPRKEIGKDGIAAAQWNGLTLVEDESFMEEPSEPEMEEENAPEDTDAVSPKKKKQNWLLSLLDES